ncbi:antiholin-like protein LrgB [Enterococcus cecorum]|uniref:antiholin-like protein LrgB n=1 Tax=Enterococcus cecorum TaxID=44008 RepID=UPI0022D406EE|nr:antiholin-like protein LrgB [Enterococcus cecorum]CAI3279069.1 antiholin-like protein LrgB [Enterococcus cecorum]CAI3301723.1 antiholin-like protein LrgB [Enterococcus cecorum]CAI3357288.1 antiholin-like protein LrgB [Enterococcus cecorum]CAI3359208.1 antiholin-like protein LrgB [Enterococcus cecorum]CAI3361747.1 antiholin-like protein LrgB [Enterococcus cecorum]
MNAYIGIIISLVVFEIGVFLFKKSKNFFLFMPLFVAMVLGVIVLKVTGISYEQYNEGGKYISFFLEPATVAFAIPLYKKRDVLKKYWFEIVLVLTIGSIGSLFSVIVVGKLIHMHPAIIASILPQAATTAIAVPISESIGGVASITAFTVIFNGVLTYALGKMALRYFRIKDEIAQGLSLGAAGHALGVAVSMELGETETAMASIAVVIVGLVTVVVVPIFAPFIGI